MNPTWLSDDAIQLLWRGMGLTLWLTLITSLLALLLGVVAGTMRLSNQRWAQWTASAYIEIHRNVPALVLILFWAFAVPNLFPVEQRQAIFFSNTVMSGFGTILGIPLAYYALAATLALSLNTGAYIAELFRAGVGTLPSEYAHSARTLGASQGEVFRKILFPQGVRAAFPAISTRLIHNMKNTALAAFVAVPELFHSTQAAINQTFRAVEFLLVATLLYLLLTGLMSALLRFIERKIQQPPAKIHLAEGTAHE